MNTLSISDLIGPLAITADDGDKVFQVIAKALDADVDLQVDFGGIATLTSVFLNAAVGHLYGVYPDDQIAKHLSWSGLDASDRELLDMVVERAREFYANPQVRAAVESEDQDD